MLICYNVFIFNLNEINKYKMDPVNKNNKFYEIVIYDNVNRNIITNYNNNNSINNNDVINDVDNNITNIYDKDNKNG